MAYYQPLVHFGRDESCPYSKKVNLYLTIKFAHLCVIRGFCVNLQFIIHWNIKYIVYEDCKS